MEEGQKPRMNTRLKRLNRRLIGSWIKRYLQFILKNALYTGTEKLTAGSENTSIYYLSQYFYQRI